MTLWSVWDEGFAPQACLQYENEQPHHAAIDYVDEMIGTDGVHIIHVRDKETGHEHVFRVVADYSPQFNLTRLTECDGVP